MSDSPTRAVGRVSIEQALYPVAAAVVMVVGLRYAAGVVAPVIFAFVAAVTAYPIQRKLMDRGFPTIVSLLATWLAVYAVFLLGALMLAVALVELVEQLPNYSTQINDAIDSVTKALGGSSGSSSLTDNISAASIVSAAESVLGGLAGIVGNVVLIVAVIFFLVIDALRFPRKYQLVSGERSHVSRAWSRWASETRVYLGVATIFGLIVAILDAGLLLVLGVPMVVVWAMLAFVTNYIPNIGFVLGVIPPALLALLTDGWQTMLWVVIGYSLINFTIQEFIQPKIIGDSVNLAATVTFVSVFFWTWVIGPTGAILCTPLTLFVRTVMLQPYERTFWISELISADVGTGVLRLDTPEAEQAEAEDAAPA